MAKTKYIRIPVSLFWPQNKKYKNKNNLTEELKTILRSKALLLLDAEYEIPYLSYEKLKNDSSGKDSFFMPKTNKKKYFSYDPGTGQMFVSVCIGLKTINDLNLVKITSPEPILYGITDFIVLDFDLSYSDNSPTVKKLKSLKAILQSVVALGDKAGIDLYKEKFIVEDFDAWIDALKVDLKDFHDSQGGIPGITPGTTSLSSILAISWPTAQSVNAYRSEASTTVATFDEVWDDAVFDQGVDAPVMSEEIGSPLEVASNRESDLNNDIYVERIGFEKNQFGFIYIKNIFLETEPEELQKELNSEISGVKTLGGSPYPTSFVPAIKNVMPLEYYPTFINYIRRMEDIIAEEPIAAPGDDPMSVAFDLYAFLELYHYPNDIPVDKLESLTEAVDDRDGLYKRSENVVEEEALQRAITADPDRRGFDALYDQTVNAPFSRMDAVETLSTNGGLHGAYGSLLSDGFNFDSMNEKQSMPWLAYPGNKKIRPSEFISDSTVAQISSGKLLARVKTIKDIENLIIKRLTIRDLLIMGLTCADRYGTPNLNVVDRIDKFLTALGSTRVFPVFKTTVPIGDFWSDFTDQIEDVIKETVEKAVVDFFKQVLVMIASCDIEGVGDQFKKGAADLEGLLTNKDGALLKFADDILTKSIQRSPRPAGFLKTKSEIKKLADAVTKNTTPVELRDCLQGNGKPQVLSAIAADLNQQLGIKAGRAAVESALSRMGRENCDMALLDDKIENMASVASTEICADFKQALRDKYGGLDDGLLDQLIDDLPDKNPEAALGFNPDFVLDPCELLKIPDPAGDFMVGNAYDSAFASVKTKFTVELNAFPMFLFDGNPLNSLNIKTELSFGLDGISTKETTEASKTQGKIKLLEDYKNLLSDKDGSLVEVISSDVQQDVRYNSIDPVAKIKRLLETSPPDVALSVASAVGAGTYERSVATLSLKKKKDPQSLENAKLVNDLEYDKEIVLKNKNYSNLSSDGVTSALISFTGLQSIDINNNSQTLSLRISTPPPSGQLKNAIESFDTTFGWPELGSFNVSENTIIPPTSQAERFSQVMTKGWKSILGPIDDSYSASFRKAMRIHYSAALDTFAGRFSRKTKYSEFLDADKILGMGIFDDPLCPTNKKDLLDLNGLVSSMETLRKNLICKDVGEQAALQRATLAGLTKTFMRVVVYEKTLPSIFYFSEVGMSNVNKEIYMAFVFSLLCAEVQGGGDDLLETMASACFDLLSETEAVEITNTEALKLVLEQVVTEVSDSVQESIGASRELNIDSDKFGQVTDHILRSILDTPIIESYGAVHDDLKNKKITEKSIKLDGRTVYPEILNVPTFMAALYSEGNQLVDTARYITYNYNGDKSDDFIEVLKDVSSNGIAEDLGGLLSENFKSLDLPPTIYDNSTAPKVISLDKQLLKDENRKRYFKDGGFLLEQFIEIQTKKDFNLKDIESPQMVKKINFNYNPNFTSLTAEEAISEGTYGETSEDSFDYINDFLKLEGSTALLNGYVGLDDFYSLATVTKNINDGFAELSQIDKDLHDILDEWKEFRYRPTAVPKSTLNLKNEEEKFKKINGIDSSGNISIFKTIESVNDLGATDGYRHVPLGIHRLIAPNTKTAKDGANFSFYIGGDSLNSTKKSMVKFTPAAFVEFYANLEYVDWEKWPYLGGATIKLDEILFDTIASFYQIIMKKQGIPLEDFKQELSQKGLQPYSAPAYESTKSDLLELNIITLPAAFATYDQYTQESQLNVAYILKYLDSIDCYIEYEEDYTWDVWEGTPYEGQQKVVLGAGASGVLDDQLEPEDCYAVFAKIYSNFSGGIGLPDEHRFHIKQLEYNSQEEKWQLSLKSSLLPRLMFYMELLHGEKIALYPVKQDLISVLKEANYDSIQGLSDQLLGYLNLQYAVPIPEDETPGKDVWDSLFNSIDVDITLPFGKVTGTSKLVTTTGNSVGQDTFYSIKKKSKYGDLYGLTELPIASTISTSYNEVDEVIFNLNAEELFWHFDHVLKNLTFYGLFLDRSRGANKIKWDSCHFGYNYYPYELVERELRPDLSPKDDEKSALGWRQFSNPDVFVGMLHVINKKNDKESEKGGKTALPLLDAKDVNHQFFSTKLEKGTAKIILKPSLLFGKTGIHKDNSSVTNFKSFNWYGNEINIEDYIDDDLSVHFGKRYNPDYLHEDTSRAGFKVLNSDLEGNALPERNAKSNEFSPNQYSRIWGIKTKDYPVLLNESFGGMKDWDPDWDGDVWPVMRDTGLAIAEGFMNLFGNPGFTDEKHEGPPSLLWFTDHLKEIWTEDDGRRKATLNTLLLNMKFYLNQIENYDTLPESHMNDWTALYISKNVDDVSSGGQGKSIRIGRTTPAGKHYELNSMTNADGITARGSNYDSEIGPTMNPFLSVNNYDCLYGQDHEKGEEAVYTPIIKVPLVRQGIPGHEGHYANWDLPIGKFSVNIQDAALFATGKAKTSKNNMYSARSLYNYDSEANTYERIPGNQTVAYKLLKNWHDKIEALRDKRVRILNNLKEKVIKFMPAGDGSFFADNAHTDYFKPLKAGVRLSYVLPILDEGKSLIPADTALPQEVLSEMVAAKRAPTGGSNWHPPLYRKAYEVVERETKQVKVGDLPEETQVVDKQIYKIPIAEAKIKISDIYGVEDADIPLAFGLQTDEDGNIKYDYSEVHEAIFKLKEELLADPSFQVLFKYSLPVEDLSTVSALGTYNTIIDSGRPGMGQMFNKTKRDLLDTMTAFSLPLSYDSAALIRSFEEQYSFSTTDPIDETGIDAQMIMQAGLMIVKSLAEITDPTVATAKAIKDVTYLGVKTTIKAGEAAFGGDASALYDNSTMRYWRSTQAMFPLILSLLPYPIIPQELLFGMGIIKPFHITPIGMTYWALSPTGLMDPLDRTLTAASKSDKKCS